MFVSNSILLISRYQKCNGLILRTLKLITNYITESPSPVCNPACTPAIFTKFAQCSPTIENECGEGMHCCYDICKSRYECRKFVTIPKISEKAQSFVPNSLAN